MLAGATMAFMQAGNPILGAVMAARCCGRWIGEYQENEGNKD